MSKMCTKCNIEKSLDEFSNDKSKKDGKRPSCRECKSKTDKAYLKNNKDKKKILDKNYYKKNQEYIKERTRKWYQQVKDVKRPLWNKSNCKIRKEKLINDPNYKIIYLLRSRINAIIVKNSIKKNDNSINYLDCSLEYCRNWLESQFRNDMSWANHGKKWHIDHVIPCATFDFSEEENMYKCFTWKNIQPLEKEINIAKKAKIDEIEIKTHYEKVEKYILENPVY